MRLIDADELKKTVRNKCWMPDWCYALIDVAIANMPTIEERKRGKWIEHDDGELSYYCSECGKHQYGNFSEISNGEFNYCPNCGADMRGGDDGKQPDLPEM